MSKIYVHIGLPKTATTSLQIDVFPKLNGKVTYVGVLQPRQDKQKELYYNFIKYIETGGDTHNLRAQLASVLKDQKPILISEEMIVVSTNYNWKVKLRRLYDIIGEFDYYIIITVREPVDALFSYYIELFHLYIKNKLSFSEIALNDERMEIFHYKKFFSFIFDVFERKRVFVFAFEDIVKNNIQYLLSLFNVNTTINIGRHNIKRKNKKYILLEKEYSLTYIVRKIPFFLKVEKRLFHCNKRSRCMKYIKNLLEKIKIKKFKKINVLNKNEAEKVRTALTEDVKYLKEISGIEYLS